MSLLGQTLVLYLLVGIGVAGAIYAYDPATSLVERWFRVLTAVPFWPLYLPLLLTRARPKSLAASPATARDEMAAAIAQVDTELEAALNGLDGWADDVLAREQGRIHELRSAWAARADRIREMDRLLALPELQAPATGTGDRVRQSEQARQQNLERLRGVRQRAYDDLMGLLAWVRELVSMIHLAKFTGAPPSRAEELIAQLAAAVDDWSHLSWRDDAPEPRPTEDRFFAAP